MSAVAVTARSFRQVPGEHQELLRAAGLPVRFAEADRPLDEEELVELVRGCWGLIVGVDPVTAAVLDAGPLQVVVRFGSGTDNVDLEAARRRGVRVAATPGANARSVAELAIGLLLAILLDQKIRGESLFRNIFLFPMSISFIVSGTAWQWLLNPSTGVNLLFEAAGLDRLKSPWFTDPNIAIYSVVLAAVWQLSGFTMAMYLAGMRGVSDELREAARVDGASEWQLYRFVIVPLLNPITLSAVIVLGHISLKIFDLVFAMTGSGPAFSTDVPGIFMFETTFRGNRFAEGAAIAIVMLLMVATVVIPYLVWSARTAQES